MADFISEMGKMYPSKPAQQLSIRQLEEKEADERRIQIRRDLLAKFSEICGCLGIVLGENQDSVKISKEELLQMCPDFNFTIDETPEREWYVLRTSMFTDIVVEYCYDYTNRRGRSWTGSKEKIIFKLETRNF